LRNQVEKSVVATDSSTIKLYTWRNTRQPWHVLSAVRTVGSTLQWVTSLSLSLLLS